MISVLGIVQIIPFLVNRKAGKTDNYFWLLMWLIALVLVVITTMVITSL